MKELHLTVKQAKEVVFKGLQAWEHDREKTTFEGLEIINYINNLFDNLELDYYRKEK